MREIRTSDTKASCGVVSNCLMHNLYRYQGWIICWDSREVTWCFPTSVRFLTDTQRKLRGGPQPNDYQGRTTVGISEPEDTVPSGDFQGSPALRTISWKT